MKFCEDCGWMCPKDGVVWHVVINSRRRQRRYYWDVILTPAHTLHLEVICRR